MDAQEKRIQELEDENRELHAENVWLLTKLRDYHRKRAGFDKSDAELREMSDRLKACRPDA